mmetsp:Transcript_67855/g.198545  ORF Transcript_67855/g.198545 Transcript_67855/m.198545 type:complete len:250 (+) Transcript_67855:1101-1850(+)
MFPQLAAEFAQLPPHVGPQCFCKALLSFRRCLLRALLHHSPVLPLHLRQHAAAALQLCHLLRRAPGSRGEAVQPALELRAARLRLQPRSRGRGGRRLRAVLPAPRRGRREVRGGRDGGLHRVQAAVKTLDATVNAHEGLRLQRHLVFGLRLLLAQPPQCILKLRRWSCPSWSCPRCGQPSVARSEGSASGAGTGAAGNSVEGTPGQPRLRAASGGPDPVGEGGRPARGRAAGARLRGLRGQGSGPCAGA